MLDYCPQGPLTLQPCNVQSLLRGYMARASNGTQRLTQASGKSVACTVSLLGFVTKLPKTLQS